MLRILKWNMKSIQSPFKPATEVIEKLCWLTTNDLDVLKTDKNLRYQGQ